MSLLCRNPVLLFSLSFSFPLCLQLIRSCVGLACTLRPSHVRRTQNKKAKALHPVLPPSFPVLHFEGAKHQHLATPPKSAHTRIRIRTHRQSYNKTDSIDLPLSFLVCFPPPSHLASSLRSSLTTIIPSLFCCCYSRSRFAFHVRLFPFAKENNSLLRRVLLSCSIPPTFLRCLWILVPLVSRIVAEPHSFPDRLRNGV